MLVEKVTSLINKVRLSKRRDSEYRYSKKISSAMLDIQKLIESEKLNEEQSTFLLDLYATYRKEYRDILHDFYYGIVVKVFVSSIFASLTYLFYAKGLR